MSNIFFHETIPGQDWHYLVQQSCIGQSISEVLRARLWRCVGQSPVLKGLQGNKTEFISIGNSFKAFPREPKHVSTFILLVDSSHPSTYHLEQRPCCILFSAVWQVHWVLVKWNRCSFKVERVMGVQRIGRVPEGDDSSAALWRIY